MAQTKEVTAILQQVEAELTAMVMAGETGRVTIHCSDSQLVVEVEYKRKHEPVRLIRGRSTVIGRIR